MNILLKFSFNLSYCWFWQTLVYFYDPIEVEQDQLIEGSVTLSQSKENARFMNIRLEYA